MSIINAILENQENQAFFEANQEVLNEATVDAMEFNKVLKEFVLSHPAEFIGETVEETYKNILTFSTTATQQFLCETSNLYAGYLTKNMETINESVSDYV